MMAKDSAVAGSISGPPLTPEQQELKDKTAEYRKKTLWVDDVVYDGERFQLLFHSKHKSLIGIDAVSAIPLSDMLAILTPILGSVIVPLLVMHQQAALNANAKKD